jgi:hypothetical protein
VGGVAETVTGVGGVATESDFLTVDGSREILNVAMLDHFRGFLVNDTKIMNFFGLTAVWALQDFNYLIAVCPMSVVKAYTAPIEVSHINLVHGFAVFLVFIFAEFNLLQFHDLNRSVSEVATILDLLSYFDNFVSVGNHILSV